MSPISVTMLGTASAVPFSDRNPSAQALSVRGRLYLLDCGEGTQQRIRQEHLSFVKIQAVFISHIHGDHIFGLYGLLSTMSLYHRTEPLVIVGPENLGPVLDFYKSAFGADDSYALDFRAIAPKQPEPVYEDGDIRVSAFPLNHGMPCYGYRIEEVVGLRQRSWKPRSYAYLYRLCFRIHLQELIGHSVPTLREMRPASITTTDQNPLHGEIKLCKQEV